VADVGAILLPQMESLPAWAVYLVVWAFIFIESGLLVGFFLPGDSLLFAAGLISGTPGSPVNIWILCTGTFIAAFVGDQIGYVLGRKLGRPWLEARQRPAWSTGVRRAEAFYTKFGPMAVIIARFIPWARTFVPFAAGIAKMHYYRFLLANVLGALIWAVGITVLGWKAAQNEDIRDIAYAIAGIFIIGSLLYMAYVAARALVRRYRTTDEPADSLEP